MLPPHPGKWETVDSHQAHQARALWIIQAGQAEIRAVEVKPPVAGEVGIRAVVSGISRGTEALVFHGKVPASEQSRMRCPFQEGEFGFPVKYGYASVGVVEQGPSKRIGERVLCLYPHQTRYTIPEAAALPVPTDVPTQRAVLAPQIETALNAMWDASPRIGERIAVVGGGVIGCLVAFLCAGIPAADVTLFDPDSDRRRIATALGFGYAPLEDAHPGSHDLVFHASGTAEGLDLALELGAFEARIIELSWHGDTRVPIRLGGAFHSQRLTIQSSQVGAVAPSHRTRWTHRDRLALALRLAADPRLDILVQEAVTFDDLPAALPRLLGTTSLLGTAGALLTRVLYPEGNP